MQSSCFVGAQVQKWNRINFLNPWSLMLCTLLSIPCVGPRTDAAELIRVKVAVDEEEPTRPEIWQRRLSTRISRASEIISRYANVRFVVQSYDTWNSDNRISDFSESLRELEQKVSTDPAQIVVGFSSQYKFHRGRHNLGGTRGPLSPYILIRENAPSVTENELVEVLVHELGHFLGAAHSARPDSVMRTVVGDGQARRKEFQIRFDPHNAEIIRILSGELRRSGRREFGHVQLDTLRRLRPHYAALDRELPGDPAASRYLQFIDTIVRQPPSTTK